MLIMMTAWRYIIAVFPAVLFLVVISNAGPVRVASGLPVSVRDHGAAGDGLAKDTAAVQRAIDACAAAGGGTVQFTAGTYLCGSLHLKSGVTLRLENGAVILGSTLVEDYDPQETLGFKNDADVETTYFHQSLIWGEGLERVAITGEGTIDSGFGKRGGPKPIALKRCKFVDISGIRILNAPNYAISLLGTDHVNIDGVTILNAFADGIDPDCCRNVRISNCHIEAIDDAIVPKTSFSLGERRSCENITVTNCFLSTRCNGFKLGTESGGDFKRIAVSNCVITGKKGKSPAIAGIALESVDGANIDGVTVSNITMTDVRAPIFLRLGNRGRDQETPTPGSLRNVIIDNVVATRASLACSVTGIPGHPVENVTLSNIRMEFLGGNPVHPPETPMPEKEDRYPEALMFGPMPAYALFVRHAEGITLSNFDVSYAPNFWRLTTDIYKKITWSDDGAPPSDSEPGAAGHALLFDDVRELAVDGLRAQPSGDGAAVLRFSDVRRALLRGLLAKDGTQTLLEVAGARSAGITLAESALQGAAKPVSLLDGVDAAAVRVANP
jgi:hypothetical protein